MTAPPLPSLHDLKTMYRKYRGGISGYQPVSRSEFYELLLAAMFSCLGRTTQYSNSGRQIIFRKEYRLHDRADLSGSVEHANQQLIHAGIDPLSVTSSLFDCYRSWRSATDYDTQHLNATITVRANLDQPFPAISLVLKDGLANELTRLSDTFPGRRQDAQDPKLLESWIQWFVDGLIGSYPEFTVVDVIMKPSSSAMLARMTIKPSRRSTAASSPPDVLRPVAP